MFPPRMEILIWELGQMRYDYQKISAQFSAGYQGWLCPVITLFKYNTQVNSVTEKKNNP